MMIGTYSSTITKAFIERRNEMAPKFNAGVFGADAEFPEHHQVEIDPEQSVNESWHFDTYHSGIKAALDYKMYSHQGIHISTAIQRCIREGWIDKLVVWRWVPWYTELKEGMEVEYEILGLVDAKKSLSQLNRDNRFKYILK